MYKNYLLNIKSYLCNFELFLNEVRVESEYNDNHVSIELPTNQWLRKDLNALRIRVIPRSENENLEARSRVEVQIILLKEVHVDYSKSVRTKVFELNSLNGEDINEEGMPLLEIIDSFVIEDEFKPEWLEETSKKFTPSDFLEMTNYYRKIHSLFLAKNTNGLLKLFSEKIHSVSKVFNETSDEFQNFILEGLKEIWKDEENELWPLEKQKLVPHYYSGGKLMCLQNEYHQPVILYYNEKLGTTTFIDLFIMKDLDSNLVVIR